MAIKSPAPRTAPVAAEALVERRTTKPVVLFAVLGGAIVLFELYVYTRWVTGPRFERVNSGPDSPPDWMKIVLNAGQVLSVTAGLACLYLAVYRPWRRDGRLSLDGLFALSFLVLSFQDPISSYFGHWFTYNSYLFNRGSFVNDIPGWNAHGDPGAMLATPIFFIIPAYVWAITLMILAGRKIMTVSAERLPQLGRLGQTGVCLVTMLVFGLVMEALILMPLGFYEYPGGPFGLNNNAYYKYPFLEAVLFAFLATSFVCLRHFTNDRGETIAEAGVSRLSLTGRRQTAVRFLAIAGAINVCMFITYNLPASWIGTHSADWPDDFQERSYFTSHICGPDTDRACPGPEVPITRPGSSYLTPSGELGTP